MLFSRLPEEVQADVFLKLPLKSIGMCRCVCKLWRNLLCSPKFIQHQLDSSVQSNNPRLMLRATMIDKQDVLYSIDYASVSSSASSRACECKEVVRMHYPFEYDQDERSVRILGSCDGLICLATSGFPFRKDYGLCIWNPLTREYKRILWNFDIKNGRLRCGFGYDPRIGDYKFVRIVDDLEKKDCFQAQVYTMRSDSWTFQSIPYVFRFGITQIPSVLLGGALHWLGATTTREPNSEVIVSFDISNERFMDVAIHVETVADTRSFGVFRDCLCLVVLGSCCMVYDIWIMQDYGVKESWNKQFTINLAGTTSGFWYPKPLWSLETGEILMSSYTDMEFYLFNPKNETAKTLSFFTPLNVWQRRVVEMEQHHCYVESLVSLGSGTYAAERSL